MKIRADDTTLNDLLSRQAQHVVPRYQREYSWEESEISELWKDIIYQIRRTSEGAFTHGEYFVGAIVLSGKDESETREIVDSQQRMITTTILLCALRDHYADLDHGGRAKLVDSTYIVKMDDKGDPAFRIKTETPKPFFQVQIQATEKNSSPAQPATLEERRLLSSYEYFREQMKHGKLLAQIRGESGADTVKPGHVECLDAVRAQVLKHTKVIRIDVDKEEDAYTIFETLNARGMNLASSDLVKNLVFKTLPQTHPDDHARTTWDKAVRPKNGSELALDVNPSAFLRHYWLSKFSMTSESRLYKHFVNFIRDGPAPASWSAETSEKRAQKFLTDIEESSKRYQLFCRPRASSWPQQQDRPVYDCLVGLSVFNVTAVRPLLLALLSARDRKTINQQDLLRTVAAIESFCFKFYAVCSLRPSGLDHAYSKTARDLSSSATKSASRAILKSFVEKLKNKEPERELFIKKFGQLEYGKSNDGKKKLVQYIFSRYERGLRKTSELQPADLTIEHIHPQSSDAPWALGIGNLIPLAGVLNNRADSDSFVDKIPVYQESELNTVKEFLNTYSKDGNWDKSLARARAKAVATRAQKDVWKIEW